MELSDEQRSAVRWQWWLVGGMIVLVVLTFIFAKLLYPVSAGSDLHDNLFIFILCGYGGLSNLAIGILSVRYEVTIQGRRIKFWEPVEGSLAVFHGWMGIAAGVFLLGIGLVLCYQSGVNTLLYLGSLFALVMLGGIIYGLRRAFAEQD